ncbi:cupin domain-containing protein [Nonomuraea sp. NPDC050663]|uniref:cupin domain-containing protein n=1 Tax=Nonomuraea sp. NPDC050663 TaxID=3364370 RepID=UPI0037BB5447
MSDGLLLPPGQGSPIPSAGMTLKVGSEHSAVWSVFEATVQPGFDVGAHLHTEAEEFFYVLDGELDLLAFHPRGEASGDWLTWESESGQKVYRGGPGSSMFVPPGTPHAFTNPGTTPARMLFVVSPTGHEHYLRELADVIGRGGPPDQDTIVELRARWDIQQLTPLLPNRHAMR